MKSRSPRTEPCGTPQVRGHDWDDGMQYNRMQYNRMQYNRKATHILIIQSEFKLELVGSCPCR